MVDIKNFPELNLVGHLPGLDLVQGQKKAGGEDPPSEEVQPTIEEWVKEGSQLIESNPDQALKCVPKNIDFSSLSRDAYLFLIKLIKKNKESEIFSLLPPVIDLHAINDELGFLLEELVKKSTQENNFTPQLIIRISTPFDVTQLPRSGVFLLESLAESDKSGAFLSFIPPRLDFSTLSSGERILLNLVLKKNLDTELLIKFPEKIDVSTLNAVAASFLKELVRKNLNNLLFLKMLFSKFPKEFDLPKISVGMGDFLNFMVEAGLNVFDQFNFTIDILRLEHSASRFVRFLLSRKKYAQVLERLIPLTTLSSLDVEQKEILNALVTSSTNKEKKEEIFFKLPLSLDVTVISENLGEFLKNLIKDREKGEFFASEVISRLTTQLDLSKMSAGASHFLVVLAEQGNSDQLLKLFPQSVDFSRLSWGAEALLEVLIKQGKADQIVTTFTLDLETSLLSSRSLKIIIDLARKESKNTIKTFLENAKNSLRQPIRIQNYELKQTLGPSLAELFQRLPIIPDSVVQLKHGWYMAELAKDGSKTFVYLNTKGQVPKIFFRNTDIPAESIQIYKLANQFLPGYVSSPGYPELSNNDEDSQALLRSEGFRESYAGANLSMLNLDLFPPDLVKSINSQINYILLKIGVHDITHGHAHNQNFNVRFLLIDSERKKKLIFDATYAVQLAQIKNWDIVPIVTLRDWDQGRRTVD